MVKLPFFARFCTLGMSGKGTRAACCLEISSHDILREANIRKNDKDPTVHIFTPLKPLDSRLSNNYFTVKYKLK
ncbi:hypothetical protein RvY_00059 [Ramazzottius varieornatus]|uniref:Uncharacterized protein n=1 Tax=Ramazzottius varieornatus TaxID=947166 RepID=A0A1D1UIU7_RAMVA|nr:hypothetical protein RvY_00059 [Ramazzottius varieornatus]